MSGWRAAERRQMARYGAHIEPIPRDESREPAGAGYTIAHAGRQIRLGPVAFWIAVGTVVIMAGWSVTTATYFAFRDDLLKGLIARQAEQQYAYEDRIAELRARIDRTTSRQLLDQEQFEQKLDDLVRRQATLESRATALGGIDTPTGSLRSSRPGAEALTVPQARDRRSSLGKSGDVSTKLSRIETSLDRVDRRQATALAAMQERYEGKARKLRGVLAELGLKIEAPVGGSGGPFVPVKLPGEGNNFARTLTRVNVARAQAELLSRSLVFVPVRKPITGELEVSSTFGVRVDPFLHIAAMHTGLDLRGETGEAVHATAAGTVTNASWSGGYGKMVEIDHGNGLATRYGHLSQIDVSVGDAVRIGQVVGRMGSTGRSTGPHLHYETRIDGEAVDPQRFLNAGAHLDGG
ncbi:MAG TPA: peptidoglycan DD-metalloendopeptidase family protein [Xanthobacteraceae bacterium]|nr:peptidoglycan DD-metalloendopeptidase family protein [Xanthobacteraceae bacterium]